MKINRNYFASMIFILIPMMVYGQFWQTTGSISGSNDAYRIVVDSEDRIFVSVMSTGIFVSSDGGNSWTNSGVQGPSIMGLAVNTNDHVFAGGNNGVYRTTNNGISWENISAGLPSAAVNSIAINNSGRIFIGFGGEKIYRSDDNGTTWERLDSGLSTSTVYVSMAINSSGHIFAGTNGSCVFRSTDNGDNWQQMCNGLSDAQVWALEIDSADRIFAGTGNGICISTDNGNSWTSVTSTADEFDINDMVINSADHIFATNNNGGVWHSTDQGSSWENLEDPVNGVVSWGLGINSDDYLFCGIGNGQVYRSIEPTVVQSDAGQALEFDGVDDFAQVGDFKYPANDLTLEVWIKPDQFDEVREVIYGLGNNSAIQFRIEADGRLTYGESPDWTFVATPDPCILNEWNHIAVVRENGLCKLYMNGVQLAEGIVNEGVDPTEINIGGRAYNMSRFFSGAIDEVRIWAIARTQSEIQANMTNYLEGTETGLIGYWQMNEGAGQTAFDLSSSGYDLQLGSSLLPDMSDPTWISTDWPYEIPFSANFSATSTSGDPPLTVQFTDLSTGNLISWEWDFENDGTVDSYIHNPEWIYNDPGTYTVSLTVSDGINTDAEIKNDYIIVHGGAVLEPPTNLSVTELGYATWEPPSEINFFDDFESYNVGEYLAVQSNEWTTWNNNPGSGEDGFISDEQALSGIKSVKVEGSTDLVHEYGNLTSGHYLVTHNIFIVQGRGGYYNLLHKFDGGNSEWALSVYFASDGSGYITAGGENIAFTYTQAAWTECVADIDLDSDWAIFYVNGTQIHAWQWSLKDNGEAGLRQLGATDIFSYAPAGDNPLFYFDDVSLASVNSLTGYKVYLDGEYVDLTTNLFWQYSGLSSGTNYLAGVSALFDDEESNIVEESFTTITENNPPIVTTNAANTISSTNATLNGTVNPNDLSTTVVFEYGPTTSYGNQITANQSPVAGTDNIAVNANLIGLSESTTYHYRVVATNSVGTTYGDDLTFTTLQSGSAPTVTTNAATNINTTFATLNGLINPNGLSTAVFFQYGETTSYGQVTADQSLVTGTTINVSVSADITGLSENTTYHYRVVASNSAGTANGADQIFITLIDYPSTYTLDHTFSFPSHSDPADYTGADYRMVGLPGNLNAGISTILTGQHGSDWQVYWDNGNAADYLVEYNNSSSFKMTTGRAFWVLHQGSLRVNTSVNTSGMNGGNQVEIPLQSGWNMITNPFDQTVSWNAVKALNNITDPIWGFNGSFSQSTQFDLYKGYYLFNTGDLTMLKIPYPVGGQAKQVSYVDDLVWKLELNFITDELQRNGAVIGIRKTAGFGMDRYDHRCPRAVGNLPAVVFERSNWDENYPLFVSDIRPEIGDLQTWDFAVLNQTNKSTVLEIGGIPQVPLVFSIRMVDQTHRRSYDLRTISAFRIETVNGRSDFSILIGQPETVEKELKGLIPEDFTLGTAFPNPFNPTTTLPLDIPYKMDVNLEVYNLLGERISRLYSGQLDAGRHYFTWDGRDRFGQTMPSGIYMVRAASQNTAFSRKIILIK